MYNPNKAISGKVDGKSTRHKPKVLWVVLSSLNLERTAREATDVCFRTLKGKQQK